MHGIKTQQINSREHVSSCRHTSVTALTAISACLPSCTTPTISQAQTGSKVGLVLQRLKTSISANSANIQLTVQSSCWTP